MACQQCRQDEETCDECKRSARMGSKEDWADRSHEFFAYSALYSPEEISEMFSAPLEAVVYWIWMEKKERNGLSRIFKDERNYGDQRRF